MNETCLFCALREGDNRLHDSQHVSEQPSKHKKHGPQAQADDGAQQSVQVVTGRTHHGVPGVAGLALEPAPFHAVVLLGVPDDPLDGLTALESTPLSGAQGRVFAAMDALRESTSSASTPCKPGSAMVWLS